MANPDLTPLDQNILARLARIERAAIPASLPSFPLKPAGELAVPLISLNQTQPAAKSDERNFLENANDISLTAGHRISCSDGNVWVSGNSLLCACPDCDAPMTIRAWLQLADCWRCYASIALSEEQIRAVKELTAKQTPVPKLPALATLAPSPLRRPLSTIQPEPTTLLPPPPPPPI